jgi:hypothetical protein
MGNSRRGPKSLAKAGAKTGSAVCVIELKNQNQFYTIGTSLGQVTKSHVALF